MPHTEQGLAIRAARIGRHLTQSHLAGLAGVSEKTVRRAEAGERIQAENVRALCAALDLDAEGLRTEAEMVPEAAREWEARLGRQAFLARAGIRATTLSVTLAMTLLVFRDAIPAIPGFDRAFRVALLAMAVLLVPAVALLAIPATRGAILESRLVRRVAGPLGLALGLSYVAAGILAYPILLAMVPLALRRMVEDPGGSWPLQLGLSVYFAWIGTQFVVEAIVHDGLADAGGKDARGVARRTATTAA